MSHYRIIKYVKICVPFLNVIVEIINMQNIQAEDRGRKESESKCKDYISSIWYVLRWLHRPQYIERLKVTDK